MIKSQIILFGLLILTATLVNSQLQVMSKNNELPLSPEEQQEWSEVLNSYDYTAIATANADPRDQLALSKKLIFGR